MPAIAQRGPAEGDERGRQQRADREAGHREPLEHAEDAREHVGRRRPLQDRPARDVEQRTRGSGHGEQEERAADGRPHGEHDERRAPDEHAEHERRQQPAAPDERDRHCDPGHAAGAEGGVQVARARAAEVEHRDREHDVEHVQRADRDVLPAEQADEHPRRRLARQDAEAGERLLASPAARRRPAPGRHRRDEQRRRRGHDRHHREHPARRGDGEQHAGQRRRGEHADALDPAGDDVGRGQLVRRAGERGHERRLRRPRDRHRRRRDRRQRVGERAAARPRAARRRWRPSRAPARRSRARARAPGGAVGEHRGERREQPRRHQLHERDEPGRRRAAALVGVDEHRDPDAPLGGVEAGERELDPPQLGVAEDAADDRRDAGEPAHEWRGSRSATAVADHARRAADSGRRAPAGCLRGRRAAAAARSPAPTRVRG